MPFSYDIPRAITFEEANPYASALSAALKNIGQMRQNTEANQDIYAKAIANKYLPSQEQLGLQKLQASIETEKQQPALLGAQTKEALAQASRAPFENALSQAQAREANIRASLPFGGNVLPGVAGQIQGLETVKQMYGEASPQYQISKKLFDANLASTQSRVGYQNALAQTMQNRYLTPTGKSILEQSNVAAGNLPTGAPGQLPVPGNELANQYELLRQKQTSDAQARQKSLYAANIDKTLDMINPDILTQYAGIPGSAKKAVESAKAPFGGESKEYDAYTNQVKLAQALAKQVRQFYGDSIQPSMLEKLDNMTDPGNWKSNPKLAKQNFKQIFNLLKNETKTYNEGLQNRNPYLGINQEPTVGGNIKTISRNPKTGELEIQP